MSKILVFNGPSSSGKTTVAKEVQKKLGTNYLRFSIDDFYRYFHSDNKNDWEFYFELNRVFFRMVSASLDMGYDAIIDTVFEREECYQECISNFDRFNVHFLGFFCPVEVLNRREIERENRPLGLAERQVDVVHSFVNYNLTVNTGEHSVEECTQKICTYAKQIHT